MRSALLMIVFVACSVGWSCAKPDTKPANTAPAAMPSTATQPEMPKDGNYKGKGTVTKIDNKLGSVELEHEKIEGLMPAMRMEFFVSDKGILKTVKVGDQVDFTLRYKDGQETVIAITKAK